MAHKILSAKSDYIFKLLFGDERNTICLASFLSAVLKVPETSLRVLSIVDPFKLKEYDSDKISVLDVKVDIGERIIDIEIQVILHQYLRRRIGFYLSSMITEQLGSGNEYGALRPAICILIVDSDLLHETKKPHSTFMMCDIEEHFTFDDLQRIDVLELPKLPLEPIAGDDSEALLVEWLRFIKTEDEGEMRMLAEANPAINHAYGVLKELSEDEATRLRNEARLKFVRDQHAAIQTAREEERILVQKEFAIAMLKRRQSIDTIVEDTKLSFDTIVALKKELEFTL